MGCAQLTGTLGCLVGCSRLDTQGLDQVLCRLDFLGLRRGEWTQSRKLLAPRVGGLLDGRSFRAFGACHETKLIRFDLAQGIAGPGGAGFVALGLSRLQARLLLGLRRCQVLLQQLDLALLDLQAGFDGLRFRVNGLAQFIQPAADLRGGFIQLGRALACLVFSGGQLLQPRTRLDCLALQFVECGTRLGAGATQTLSAVFDLRVILFKAG